MMYLVRLIYLYKSYASGVFLCTICNTLKAPNTNCESQPTSYNSYIEMCFLFIGGFQKNNASKDDSLEGECESAKAEINL